jgi:hypothetical protein
VYSSLPPNPYPTKKNPPIYSARGCLENFSFASGMPSLFLMFFKNKNRHNTVQTGKQENVYKPNAVIIPPSKMPATNQASFSFFYWWEITA